MAIRMRVRGPGGTETIQGEDTWTLRQLVAHIREKTGVADFSLKTGFPPAPLDLTAGDALLGELRLNGAVLTLVPAEKEEAAAGPSSTAPQQPGKGPTARVPSFEPKRVAVDETVVEWEDGGGFLGERQDTHARPSCFMCMCFCHLCASRAADSRVPTQYSA